MSRCRSVSIRRRLAPATFPSRSPDSTPSAAVGDAVGDDHGFGARHAVLVVQGQVVYLTTKAAVTLQTPTTDAFAQGAPTGTELSGGFNPGMLGDPPNVPTAELDLDSVSSTGMRIHHDDTESDRRSAGQRRPVAIGAFWHQRRRAGPWRLFDDLLSALLRRARLPWGSPRARRWCRLTLMLTSPPTSLPGNHRRARAQFVAAGGRRAFVDRSVVVVRPETRDHRAARSRAS